MADYIYLLYQFMICKYYLIIDLIDDTIC